ncbi:MAG: efflux RND transporter permease subunit [Proteobacteria bacterium]|nr:efflux RND transporter permease subunit [Pseudomonadota bacterium]
MWFTRISIGNPVFATMLMLAFIVLGLFSWQRLRVDQFPDIEFPVVVVSTAYPGASPESVESDVTRKIEEAVNTINGIKSLYSRSYEGLSVVIVEFELTVVPSQAAQDVRDKVAIVKPLFRREVKEPKISRFDPADRPIISIAVTARDGARQLRELTTLADQVIRKRIENVRGVGSVTLVGGVKREVHINLKPAALEAYALGADQVINAVTIENQELPAGALRAPSQEHSVQIKGRLKEVGDFERIVVARRGGQPVYLHQVATVEDGAEEQDSLALVNGRRTLALDILKAQGQNTIDVADAVKEAMARMQKELPADVQLSVIKDASVPIRVGVNNVQETMVEGAGLTILIVFLFLTSWRSTVITGLTLPVAIIGTFLFIYAFGFTINMLTLMALSLCVGLLIDDAIVVRENIVRHAALGADHKTAALEGTREIGLAVLATTLSIVAVFLPVGFMGGIIGRFFHQFGVTVAAAVLISMFVSFTLDPMLSSVWPDPAVHGVKPPGLLGRVLGWFERLVVRVTAFYGRLLGWSLRHRFRTMLVALATFVGSFLLAPLLGTEFVPQADFSETQVAFQTPVGSSLELTETKARQVDAALREFPEVLHTYTAINTGGATGKNSASLYVKLKPRAERTRNQFDLTVPIRARLEQIGGIVVTHVGTVNPVGGWKLLIFSVQGPDLKMLEKLTAEAWKRLSKIPGLVDLDTSLKPDKPTVDLDIRRDVAADLGIGVGPIAQALRPFLAGEEAGTWRGPDDENYDVIVRLAPADRDSVADLERVMLASSQPNADGSPKMVALRQVAKIIPGHGVSQINRRDLTREVEFTANVYGRAAGQVGGDIKKALAGMDWPPGYGFKVGGSTKDMEESFAYAAQSLALAIVFIYMILASQFKSFLQPLAIMSSLPLTLIGVILSLLAFRSTLNLFSIIGFIMLMGLVTKNAILLVDFANQSRAAGMERDAALIEAAHVRLRPILMTTLAMVFGMLPLALGVGEGSEQRAPMGQAVIGGVITSSLLTLVVVPVIYSYLDDLVKWLKR